MLGLWLAAVMLWWAIAFVRLPPATPEWLVRARNVCFRTFENGLPDAAGWLLLVVPPAGMFAVLWLGWRTELAESLRVLRTRRSGRGLLALVASVVAIEALWVGGRVREGLRAAAGWVERADEEAPLAEDFPRLDRPLPRFALVDQRGQSFTAEDLHGETTLVTFAFGHCTTICPPLVRNIVEAASRLEPRPRVVILTVDPWRDTPSVASQAAARLGLAEKDRFLTGSVAAVEAALDGFGVPRSRDETTGDVSHPALAYVVDPRGRIAFAFSNPRPRWLVEAVRRLRESR
jgi:protein SCO1/2